MLVRGRYFKRLSPAHIANVGVAELWADQFRQTEMDPPSYSLILLLCSLGTALSRDDVTSYDPGPYKRVYPPANLSLEQQSCQPDAATNQTCPLYVALMMSFGGVYTSSGVIPAVEVALDQINLDPNMLPGYTLHYTLKDSQVNTVKGHSERGQSSQY